MGVNFSLPKFNATLARALTDPIDFLSSEIILVHIHKSNLV